MNAAIACVPTSTPSDPASASADPAGQAPAPTFADAQAWAEEASASLQLPAPTPVIGPDPMRNEWKMLAVGLPVWVWASTATSLQQTTTTNGITISFQAVRSATAVDWGDGVLTTCTTMTPRPSGTAPMQPSPDCGHTYQRKGSYSVAATSMWTVFWQALGFSGVLYIPRSGSAPLTIGELHAVITERH